MQTKKRFSGSNASREHACPKVSRAQKKSEKLQGSEKKAAELITSSVRKQRVAGTLLNKSKELEVTSNLNASHGLGYDETSNTWLNKDAVNDAHLDSKCHGHNGEGGNEVLDNIFSPAFHLSKFYGGQITNGGIHQDGRVELSQIDMVDAHIAREASKLTSCEEMLVLDSVALNSHCGVDLEGVALSSEVSAIYLAMKNSKLECVDEHGQDSLSTEIHVEDEYYEGFDEFDPYLFIKNLPALSSVVPTFRPMLLPKQTRRCPRTTLVLDLDETLVHSTLEPCADADFTFPVIFNDQEHKVYVRCRPHLMDFMERVSSIFEIIIFTASQGVYAEQVLNVLDPRRKVFRHRVFRESCVFVDGNYLKDLSILGRDLAHVIIIDNSPQAFGFQVDNGIPIESWFDDRSDQELLLLLPFLESLVEVEDVRPFIAQKFNLRQKIAAAVYAPFSSNEADPLER